jgi:hypothetical protein
MLEHVIEGCQCEGKICSRCPETGIKCLGLFYSNKARDDKVSVYCRSCTKTYTQVYTEINRDHIKEYARALYQKPEQKVKKQTYYREHADQILESRKLHWQRPGVKERHRINQRIRYHRSPKVREWHRVSYRRRYSNLEWREQKNARERNRYRVNYQISAYRERSRERDRVRRSRPEVQEQLRAYRRRPEVQEQMRIRSKRHEQLRRLRPGWSEYRRARDARRRAREKAVDGIHTSAQIAEQLKRQHYRCYYAKCGFSKFLKVNGKYQYHVEHTYPLSRVAGTDIPANDMSYLVLSCGSCNDSKGNKYPWEFPEGGRLL